MKPRTTLQTAMNLLARREHSETELKRKLRSRKFPEADIEAAITELRAKNLLSNTRFLENYIHYRRNKGYGPIRIRMELRERGIPEESIDHHLNMSDNAWFTEAHRVWQKRFKGQLPHDAKTHAMQLRFLHYRGFTHEQINSLFDEKVFE